MRAATAHAGNLDLLASAHHLSTLVVSGELLNIPVVHSTKLAEEHWNRRIGTRKGAVGLHLVNQVMLDEGVNRAQSVDNVERQVER